MTLLNNIYPMRFTGAAHAKHQYSKPAWITPIQGLLYSAILYGLTAPVLIAIILHICNNPAVMGKNVNGAISK